MNKFKLSNFSGLPEKYILASLFMFTHMFFAPLMYLSQYFSVKGMDIKQIGILMAVNTFVAILGQFFWGNVADKAKTINNVMLLLTAFVISASVLYIFAKGYLFLLICVIFFAFFSSSIFPLLDTITLTRSQISGIHFGKLRMMGTIGFLIAALIGGFFAQINMYFIFYNIMFVGLIYIAVILFVPKVHGQREKGKHFNVFKFLKNKDILFLFMLSMTVNFTFGFHFSFFPVYFTYDLKGGAFLYGVLMFIAALIEIPILLKLDTIFKKVTIKPALITAALFTATRWLFYGLFENIIILIALAFLQGATLILMHYYICVYLNKKSPPEGKATVQMLLYILTFGVARILGSVFGAFTITGLGGIKNIYLICTATIIIACVIFSFGKFEIAEEKCEPD